MIPLAFTVTAPAPDTAKSSVLNDATPAFEPDASSPAIVTVLLLTVISVPSPAVNVRVSPVLKVSVLEPSDRVKLEVTVAKES